MLRSVVEDVHCGRLSLLVAPAADDDRVTEDIRRGRRAGAPVGRSGGRRPCERRTRLRSSSVSSRSTQNGGCRAADTVVSWDQKAIASMGRPHRGFVKRGFAARTSANRKRCGYRSSEAPAGAISKVHSRGQMRLYRGDARRKTAADPTEEVVGRAPLRRRWDRSRSRDEKPSPWLRLRRQSWSSKSTVVI